MTKRRTQFAPAISFASETLESRVVLSGTAHHLPAHVAAVHHTSTKTTLTITPGTLGQSVTFNVSVRGAAGAGAPKGSVAILDHGQVMHTISLSPSTSTNPKYAVSASAVSMNFQPGGAAYFFGQHQITAQFIPAVSTYAKSNASAKFTVPQPNYTSLANGVQVAASTSGSGPKIQSGQTAGMLYTGYLAKNGQIFDMSSSHGGTPFNFQVGAGQVIPGFDAGAVGMQVGETRIVSIPAAQGYGNVAQGTIPANSDLIFVITLTSIA